ncbi:metal-sensitive transcriptional regulator [Chitinispirillales bacterium ANBcel5]|uniref:metal-sensitive transcriptional regulator n=1 Tax=Cellulosispirillum alkaliphilum TaxID=3039283 RepID=UPI002A518F67|nr:metal-sensitive transcriptional regulator [Chitinispirillales bacterium ANBcel5]
MGTGKNERSDHELKANHSDKLKSNLVSRLNRIEGQIRGAKKMVENDTYCDDVLNLLASIQSALSGVCNLLVEHHIKGCVVKQIQQGDVEVIDELMKTIRRMSR